jgi:hypothetical protein
MAGEQQRHRLVAQLPVAHRPAVFVARLHHPRQQILARAAAAPPPLLDHRRDQRVELADAGEKGAVGRRRQPFRECNDALEPSRQRLDAPINGASQSFDVPREFQIEEHAGDNAQGQPAHLRQQLARPFRLPAAQHRLRPLDDKRRIAFQPLRLERRRDQPVLPAPMLALAGQQTLAEKPTRVSPEERVLDERALLIDQYLLNQIGAVQQVGGPAS